MSAPAEGAPPLHTRLRGALPAALKGIHDSLKPGGVFIVIDHRAAKGAGAEVTSTLHRMDEDIAKQEIEAAGFKLVAESKALTRDSDDRTKKVFEAGEHDHSRRKPGDHSDQIVIATPLQRLEAFDDLERVTDSRAKRRVHVTDVGLGPHAGMGRYQRQGGQGRGVPH